MDVVRGEALFIATNRDETTLEFELQCGGNPSGVVIIVRILDKLEDEMDVFGIKLLTQAMEHDPVSEQRLLQI